MEISLMDLYNKQLQCFRLDEYRNEFETMRWLFDSLQSPPSQQIHEFSLIWFQMLIAQQPSMPMHRTDFTNRRLENSKKHRAEGNRQYNMTRTQSAKAKVSAKTNGKICENTLAACRFYTEAILEASIGANVELAYAFANRALALQTIGYYHQAYDDCLCALSYGYPSDKLDKIYLRQAYCAFHMGNKQLLAKHLAALKDHNLSGGYRKQFDEIMEGLKKLNCLDDINKPLETNVNQDAIQNKDSIQITDSSSKYGRYVKAKRSISKYELIFCERAQAVVPTEFSNRVCSQCAITNFIPMPCVHCHGHVVYCSLNCLNNHKLVHSLECPGYQMNLFSYIGIGHLVLRTITDDGLLIILPHIKHLNSTTDVWESLTCSNGTWWNSDIPYVECLNMPHHLDKLSLDEIKIMALLAHHLVIYFKYYTNFFQIISNKMEMPFNWELIVAALLLRHIGQLICNAHTCMALVPMQIGDNVGNSSFHLLNEHIWHKAWHLKLGYLHTYHSYGVVATMNLPLTSLCNHACRQTIQLKFSGRKVGAYAMCDFKNDDEITNCYVPDYRQQRRAVRRAQLEASYHFKCKCRICLEHQNDDVFEQFHQYRCSSASCGKIFVPNLTNELSKCLESTEWLQFACTICGAEQEITWLQSLKDLLSFELSVTHRKQLYEIYESLDDQLLGLNDCKSHIADYIVENIFNNLDINDLDDEDFKGLLKMLKFRLSVLSMKIGRTSIPYVATMTYLWDIIAIGKYVCDKAEISAMLEAVNLMADDIKNIFTNYYNDYLKRRLE